MAPPSKLKALLAKFESNINGSKAHCHEPRNSRQRDQPTTRKPKGNASVIIVDEHSLSVPVPDASNPVEESRESPNGSRSSPESPTRAKVGFAECVKSDRDFSTRNEKASPSQDARPNNSVKSLAAFFELQSASRSERKSLGNRSIQSAPEKSTKLYRKWTPPGKEKACSALDSERNKTLSVASEHIRTTRSKATGRSSRRVTKSIDKLDSQVVRLHATDAKTSCPEAVERNRTASSIPLSSIPPLSRTDFSTNTCAGAKGMRAVERATVPHQDTSIAKKGVASATAVKLRSSTSLDQSPIASKYPMGDPDESESCAARTGTEATAQVHGKTLRVAATTTRSADDLKTNAQRLEEEEVDENLQSGPDQTAAVPVEPPKNDAMVSKAPKARTRGPGESKLKKVPGKKSSKTKSEGTAVAKAAPATPSKCTSKTKGTKALTKKTKQTVVVSDPSLSPTSPNFKVEVVSTITKTKKKASATPPVTKMKKTTKKAAASFKSKKRDALDPCTDVSPLVHGKATEIDCHASFCMTESPLEYSSFGFASTSSFGHESDDDSTIVLEFDFEDDYSIGEESACGRSFASSTADFLCHLMETKESSQGGGTVRTSSKKTSKRVRSKIEDPNNMSTSCTSGTETESCSSFDGYCWQNDRAIVQFGEGSRRQSSTTGRR